MKANDSNDGKDADIFNRRETFKYEIFCYLCYSCKLDLVYEENVLIRCYNRMF